MGRGRLRREPGPMKGFAPPGFERAPIYDEPMNGFVPMRCGIGVVWYFKLRFIL